MSILNSHSSYQKRIGEILIEADFFVLDWYNLIKEQPRKPLGWYLQKAKLLKKKILTVF